MSHVDEGALHAYLDGALDEYPAAEAEGIRAHLDACSECARRLEAERSIRSDAHAMLGLAAPVVELPSLEELRAYVQRTAQQRRGISRLQRMGWAASVVLALGAGWMLRDGQLQSRAMDIGNELAPRSGVSSAGAPGETREESAEPVGARFADEADPPVATGASREAGTVQGGVNARLRADERAVEAPAVFEAETAPVQSLPSSPAEELVARDADLAKVDVAAAGAAPDDRLQEAMRLEEEPAREALEQTAIASADAGVPAPADAVAMAPATGDSSANDVVAGGGASDVVAAAENQAVATGADSSGLTGEEARRRQAVEASMAPLPVIASARSEVGVTRGNADAEVSSRSVEVELDATDEEPPAEPLLAVPGHDVVDVTNLGEGSTAWGARVRQRMEDGRAFEVFHLEPGIDPSILPPMETGTGEASAETPFGWVLVRGSMEDAELRELLLSLFPESP